jgi:hypothetical protein
VLIIQSGSLAKIPALPLRQGFMHTKEGDSFMAVSYKKLWKLLIDKDMKANDRHWVS